MSDWPIQFFFFLVMGHRKMFINYYFKVELLFLSVCLNFDGSFFFLKILFIDS